MPAIKSFLHWLSCHTVVLVLAMFLAVALIWRGPLFGLWPQPEPSEQVEPAEQLEPAEQAEPAPEAALPQEAEALTEVLVEAPLPIPADAPPENRPDDRIETPSQASVERPTAPESIQVIEETGEATTTPGSDAGVAEVADSAGPPTPEKEFQAMTQAEPQADIQAVTQAEAAEPALETAAAEAESNLPQPVEEQSAAELPTMQSKPEADFSFRPVEEAPMLPAIPPRDLLQEARRAYWNDQLDQAAELYRSFIEQQPENPDGYGELGNLLSLQGKLDEAAPLYREAAQILTAQGKIEEAQQLKDVLASIEVIQGSSQ